MEITGTYNYTTDRVGKADFLKLLTAELKFQDPLAPVDNMEFMSQLTQLSSLEQLLNIEEALQNNFLLTQSLNNSLATTFIGKTIKAEGNAIYLKEEGDAEIHYELSNNAEVKVNIYDENGTLVRTINCGWQLKGKNKISWDGLNNHGTRMPEGKYTFEVEAKDSEGNAVEVKTYTYGRITGIRFVNGIPVFLIGDIEVNFSDVYEILDSDG